MTSSDIARARALLDWLDQQPIDMHEDLNAARRALQNCERTVSLLRQAIARVALANAEGDPILSAWLPDAKQVAFGAKPVAFHAPKQTIHARLTTPHTGPKISKKETTK